MEKDVEGGSKPSFEEMSDVIDREIEKRRRKWSLTAISWMDYDDVAQIIRRHIWLKWEKYNHKRPLSPWLNTIISNQIRNVIRDRYGNYSRPCLKCAAAQEENGCEIYGSQCKACPLYSNWVRTKKDAYDTKLPVSIEYHNHTISNNHDDNIDIDRSFQQLNVLLEKSLKPIEWKVYKLLFIENKTEREVAKEMGYMTSEKNRSPGYRQIRNLKKAIVNKAKKHIYEDIHF